MIKLILFIFVCSVISKSYLQEIHPSLLPPKIGSDGSQTWPFPNYQGYQRIGAKPCPRRRNSNNAEQQWIPSYTSKYSHPLYPPPILEPQALKNDDLKFSEDVPKSEFFDPKLVQEDNPLSILERKTLSLARQKPSHLNDEDDCDDLSPRSDIPSFTPDPEHLAMKLVKDCLEKKHRTKQALEQPARSSSDSSNVYSRRSMSETDPDDSGYLEDDGDEINVNGLNDTDPKRADRRSDNTVDGLGSPNNKWNTRICYACSTATNPLCWEPDNRTTIKYCNSKQSCVTKTFGIKNSMTIIRDCANSCEDSPVAGVEPKFKSCKICHKDYCNGANSINSYIYHLAIILVISIAKCTFDF